MLPQLSASGVVHAQLLSPMKALALLSTLQSADIVLPTTDGREIRLRRITEPDGRTEIPAAPARPQSAATFEVSFKM